MAIKVAINGFGRIGRLAFRRIQDVSSFIKIRYYARSFHWRS